MQFAMLHARKQQQNLTHFATVLTTQITEEKFCIHTFFDKAPFAALSSNIEADRYCSIPSHFRRLLAPILLFFPPLLPVLSFFRSFVLPSFLPSFHLSAFRPQSHVPPSCVTSHCVCLNSRTLFP